MKLPNKCPGILWQSKYENYLMDLDVEIKPLVEALNKLSYLHTTASCAGHSLREMRQAREDMRNGRGSLGVAKKTGWFIDAPYRITLTAHVHSSNSGIRNFVLLMQSFSELSRHSFFQCELGYRKMAEKMDNSNFETEADYIPFEITVEAKTKKNRDALLKKYLEVLSH